MSEGNARDTELDLEERGFGAASVGGSSDSVSDEEVESVKVDSKIAALELDDVNMWSLEECSSSSWRMRS